MNKLKEVGFTAVEPFAVCKLDDGNVVKVKIVMSKILRVIDPQGQPAFGPDGSPWYELKMTPHIVVEQPGEEDNRQPEPPQQQPGQPIDLGKAQD